MSLDLGICLAADRDARETARLAVLAEDAGFDYVWVTDTQGLWRDAYVTLALVASATRSVRIGTMVTNPVTRHPSVTAGAIATLDEASGGRAVLGLGAGRSSLRLLGRRESLSECRDAVRQIRSLLSGDAVEYGGNEFSLDPDLHRKVPIYVSGSGPRMLQTAASDGDGVIFVVGAQTELAAYALRNIDQGLRTANKTRDESYLINYVQCSVDDARTSAYDAARAMAGFHWRELPVPTRESGVAKPDDLVYDYEKHYSVTNDIRSHVTDDMVDRFIVAGEPVEVSAKLEALARMDIDQLTLYQVQGTERFIRSARGSGLLEHLRSAHREQRAVDAAPPR